MTLQFNPSDWHVCDNNWQTCTQNSNCYAYALNCPDYHWAMPGMGFAKTGTLNFLQSAGKVFDSFASDGAFRQACIDGAKRDGLLPVNEPEQRDGYYTVALFFSEDGKERDVHWYRQDDDGSWSHKDGRHNPSQLDADGKPIRDPRCIATTNYPLFGGFFLVPRSGVKLTQDFPLIKK